MIDWIHVAVAVGGLLVAVLLIGAFGDLAESRLIHYEHAPAPHADPVCLDCTSIMTETDTDTYQSRTGVTRSFTVHYECLTCGNTGRYKAGMSGRNVARGMTFDPEPDVKYPTAGTAYPGRDWPEEYP